MRGTRWHRRSLPLSAHTITARRADRSHLCVSGVSEGECGVGPPGFPTRGQGSACKRGEGWMDEPDGRRFSSAYHQARPGVTELFFALADTSRYAWPVEPLRGTRGAVLDPAWRFATHPRSAAGGRPGRDRPVGGRACRSGTPGQRAAGTGRRGRAPVLLRERGGRLCGEVPAGRHSPAARPHGSPARTAPRRNTRGTRVLPVRALPVRPARLGPDDVSPARRTPAVARSAGPRPTDRPVRTAGFSVRRDDWRVLTPAIDSADAAALPADALYLPGPTAHRIQAAKRSPARWSAPGRSLEPPLRRVVADLPTAQPSQEPI